MSRLPAALEAGSLRRRAEADGGFATILKSGDEERGSLLLVIASRGQHHLCLERMLSPNGSYQWVATGPDGTESREKLAEFLENRIRFDEDLWVIELDIAHPERFIAETIADA